MSVKIFSQELINSLSNTARRSPRIRQHLNIHRSYEDPGQRFFNAIGVDSYIRPHRHSLDPKAETLIAIQGMFALISFDNAGLIEDVVKFGTERFFGQENLGVGVELQPGAWHTVIALTSDAVLLELKAGPFVPTVAKEPAPWAAEEGTAEALDYLNALRAVVDKWPLRTKLEDMAA